MPSPDAAETLVLVDALGLVYQVFHALREPMTAADGRPTNAVFGFTRDLFRIQEELKPDYLAFVFDHSDHTFRNELYPEYKAHRPPQPADLGTQIPMIQQVITAMRIPVLCVPGFEADDVLATVAREGRERGLQVALVTSDKDCRQCIAPTVRMYSLRKGTYLDADAVKADWGVGPEQTIDYQSLVGDSTDNVPGAKGIGPTTAAKLLQEFGTLEAILKAAETPGKNKALQKVHDSRANVLMSRELVKLDDRVPMEFAWDVWRRHPWNKSELLGLFEEYGFRSFASRVRNLPDEKSDGEGLFAQVQADAYEFNFGANVQTATTWVAEYHLTDTPEAFAALRVELQKQPTFAFDLETTDLDPLRSEIVGIALTWKPGEAWYIPLRAPADCPRLDPATTLAALKPLFENPAIGKRNQNIKYDMLALSVVGIAVAGVAGDPMVADYLLRSGERSHNLDDMAQRYFQHANTPITDLIGKKGKNQIRMDQVPTAKVAAYAGEDVDVAWRLCELLEPEVEREKLGELYRTLELPLIGVLADMEATGIRVDVAFLARLALDTGQQLELIEKEIYALAGHEFNIGSLKQLRTVLYDELKLPVFKRSGTTGDPSTDQESLESLAPLHALPRKIVEQRQIAKLKGTYVDALPLMVNPRTGRLHTSFNQTVAATGRLSSSDPNLQNIPARTDMGKQIRAAFLPAEGWQLVTADYSQVELRLLAHFSGDAALRSAFADNADIHARVAAQIFKVDESAVTSAQRRMAKTVNFGVIYGISPHGLSTRLGIGRDEAAKFIDDYFQRFPAVQEYQLGVLKDCLKKGYVGTLLGRKRKIAGVRPRPNIKNLNQPEREAINMEIQGSAADMLKVAMLRIHARLRTEQRQGRLLLTVHDELVLECPPGEVSEIATLVRAEMIAALPLTVPLAVDVAAGPNWLEGEEIP